MKRIFFASALCAALAFAPALADDDDAEGFFFGIELTSLQPSGMQQDYVLQDPDDSNSAAEGSVRAIEFDNEMAPRIFLGHMYDNGGAWAITYWDYDEDETDSVSATTPTALWDILFHADDAFDDYEGTASAALNVQATLIDIEYSRPLTQSDNFGTRWTLGFRSAELESSMGVLYDDGFSINTVGLASSAEGTGVTGGLNGHYKLGDRWMIGGGSSFSLLMGEIESATLMDDGSLIADITTERDATLSILEANASVIYHGPDWLYLWLGYEFAQWNNFNQTNLFPDDVAEGFVQSDTTDVSWSGWTFGAGFKF